MAKPRGVEAIADVLADREIVVAGRIDGRDADQVLGQRDEVVAAGGDCRCGVFRGGRWSSARRLRCASLVLSTQRHEVETPTSSVVKATHGSSSPPPSAATPLAVLHDVFGHTRVPRAAGGGGAPRHRRRRCGGAVPDRRGQIDVLPDPGDVPARRRGRDLAADRPDARPGRGAEAGGRCRGRAQLLDVAGAAGRGHAACPRRCARPALCRARAARRAQLPPAPHGPRYRALCDRRGALREPVGPRLPAGVSRARDPRRCLPACAAHRADRDRRSDDARRHHRAPAARRGDGLRAELRPAQHRLRHRRSGSRGRSSCSSSCRGTRARAASSIACRAPRSTAPRSSCARRGSTPCPTTPGWTRPSARPTRTPSSRTMPSASSRRSRSAWASTSPTCATSRISTCRPRSRPTTRRPAAPAATACRPMRGWPTAWPTSSRAAA